MRGVSDWLRDWCAKSGTEYQGFSYKMVAKVPHVEVVYSTPAHGAGCRSTFRLDAIQRDLKNEASRAG